MLDGWIQTGEAEDGTEVDFIRRVVSYYWTKLLVVDSYIEWQAIFEVTTKDIDGGSMELEDCGGTFAITDEQRCRLKDVYLLTHTKS